MDFFFSCKNTFGVVESFLLSDETRGEGAVKLNPVKQTPGLEPLGGPLQAGAEKPFSEIWLKL